MGVNATVTEAQDLGLAAWTLDPAYCAISGSFVATTQYLASFYWRQGPGVAQFPTTALIPNVIVGSWTQVQMGIICQDQVGANAPGTLLAASVAALPTAGITSQALVPVAAAPATLPNGRYWLALRVVGTTGTALAAVNPGTSGSLGINLGTDVAHSRFGISAIAGALVNIVPANIISTTSAGLCLCGAVL
jgi:hypothetical protein